MKQYLPMKPVKRGFKIWYGRTVTMDTSVSSNATRAARVRGLKLDLGGSVVTRLTWGLVGKAYHIFIDNFFSSVALCNQLLLDNIYCTGTLRPNRRNFPPDLKDAAKRGLARRGDLKMRQDGNVCVCVWQDTRPVTFMSSGHNPTYTKDAARKRRDGSIVHVNCPLSIIDYNKYMGGLDLGDQYRK